MTPTSCRFTTEGSPLPQQQDFSPELESICNSQVPMPPPTYQRSQSVPPLPQHTLADQRIHPLTPQTDTRLQQRQQHLTPSPMENSNQHLNGLKQLRNRVLHGDVNNNGSRPNENFTARRNLTSALLNVNQSEMSHSWTGHQFPPTDPAAQPEGTGHEQEMAVLESNLNELADLNTFDDATTEAVIRNICNNTSGVWPTGDMNTWQTSQALEIMD